MPLQNRVDPFGDIHAVAARGLYTGNRGVIHDADTKTLLKRRWTTKAWIICVCDFRGHRRAVMGRNTPTGNAGWTELFFLDEVTALAAGHRPCFYCQRERAMEFADRFGAGNGIATPKAPAMDERLHGERRAAGGPIVTLAAETIAALPDGAMIADAGTAYAIRGGRMLRWSFDGYAEMDRHDGMAWRAPWLVTPQVTVAALAAGYRPRWA